MTSLVRLSAGRYAAAVDLRGAALAELTLDGRPLVLPRVGASPSEFRGAVLVPWPNRVLGAAYEWRGAAYELVMNEPELGHALHGLVLDLPFTVSHADTASVEVAAQLPPSPGYAGQLDVRVTYALHPDDGLTWTITSTNRSDTPLPYAAGFHPYLVAGTGTADDWTLDLAVSQRITVDETYFPTGVAEETSYQAEPLRGVTLDHAFRRAGQAPTLATLRSPAGEGVEVLADPQCTWVQVYTGDGPGLQRRAVAIEPQTAPPDAFRSGIDVVELAPGATHSVWCQLRGVTASR